MAKHTLQDLVLAFLSSEISIPDSSSTPILPSRDFFFIEDQNLFFYRKDPTLPLLAPFKRPDFMKASTLKRLLFSFLTQNYPDVSVTPSLLADAIETLVIMTPATQSLPTAPTSVILFDDIAYDFSSLSFTTPKPTDLSVLSFPYSYETLLASHTPVFDAFIAQAFPDDPQSFRTYFMTLIGYLLAPAHLVRQIPTVFFLYGETGAGKSVFLDLIESMFPDYLKSSLSLEALTGQTFAIAELAGKQINIVDEDESEYVSGGKLKALTSFRPMMGVRKFEQPFRFIPNAKLLFASNHLPTLKNMDPAVERRLHLIPFEHPIAPHLRDPRLAEKLIKEIPGILLAALTNITNLIKSDTQTFQIPSKMTQTRSEFMNESIAPVSFFSERYVQDPEGRALVSVVYRNYVDWSKENGKTAYSKIRFLNSLKVIPGLTVHRGTNGNRVINAKELSVH